MNQGYLIPACYPYIIDPVSREIEYNVVYSVACYAMKANPQYQEKDVQGIYDALKIAGILPGNVLIEELMVHETITCFWLVSKYKCNFICPLCQLSLMYKNKLEAEESHLLSYALENRANVEHLSMSGVNSAMFRALLLIQTNPAAGKSATINLHRLLYELLQRHRFDGSDTSDIVPLFLSELTNRSAKFEIGAVDMIKQYIKNLQGYRIKTSDIDRLLEEVFHLQPVQSGKLIPIIAAKEAYKVDVEPKLVPGLFDDPLTMPNPQKPIKKIDLTSEHCTQSPMGKIAKSEPFISEDEVRDAVNSPQSINKYLIPSTFSKNENYGYPFFLIDSGSVAQEIAHFHQFLLQNPLLAIEIVDDAEEGGEFVLLCAKQKNYYFSSDDNNAIMCLQPYISKTKLRKLICFDPYRLYHFLYNKGLRYDSVYAIRTVYAILAKYQNRVYQKTPEQIIKEFASRTNRYQLPFHIFAMQHYADVYQNMIKMIQKVDLQIEIEKKSKLDFLYGISYYLGETTESQLPLFKENDDFLLEFQFHHEIPMLQGFYSITYTFKLAKEDTQECFITELLTLLATGKLINHLFYRLLYSKDHSITLAVRTDNASHVSERVVNLASSLSQKMGLFPIIISET